MDLSIKYNNYKFIGYEFLTSVYYLINKKKNNKVDSGDNYSIGKKIVFGKFENGKIFEKTTISGNNDNEDNGKLLLSDNALVIELNIIINYEGDQYSYALKGDDLSLNSLKTPPVEVYGESDEYEGSIIEKVNMCKDAFMLLDKLFKNFIELRMSDKWDKFKIDIINYATNENITTEDNE